MPETLYVVTMYRWGDYENHSYVLGVFSSYDRAYEGRRADEIYRGGKYEGKSYKLI